jgi:hypothetical protein
LQGRLARRLQLFGRHRLAPRPPSVKSGELYRPGETAGMGGKNATLTSVHHPPGYAGPLDGQACLQQGLL